MARDLASMGQQIEQLKASIAELKASQQVAAPRCRQARRGQNFRSKSAAKDISAATAIGPRRPPAGRCRRISPCKPQHPQRLPPPLAQAAPAYTSPPPAPYSPQAADQVDDPVVRPPMPLR